MPYITAVLHPEITFMDRRKSLKILGGTAVGIAGLVLVDWKWQLVDQLTHKGFFSFKEEELITAIADTIIPAGLPPKVPTPDAQPIGALSTGTDKYLIRLFEHCYEKNDQDLIKAQLASLAEKSKSEIGKSFDKATQEEREGLLLSFASSENEKEKKFFDLIKSQTITGFTTVKEVMVDYRGYKMAPGYFHGCIDVPSQA
ncbi:gluconate 2-dehydrogenase subunit 3 family protein [Aquiflexum gelatinilyticum]|uniref:gluconate 2-dehydrogenase subunit 3 family protein n=1 Tax=Aquiflexum gelatinilyticum TaxID=2961943 RepID=UPI002167A837|nr:gluconate 2-dehydrogenase subunit 3 family protein [Aquiflexum gelatinilyticum]MCS4436542.1 gluconate 2-dehydrogenase subunit 3 family protein [Aquiflexum gelatinilyticum]